MNASTHWVAALTGGVASGKSAVAERFERLGIAVHDADVAAREAVAPGSEGLRAIVTSFGEGVLDEHGALDRRAMRARVFEQPSARLQLEAIVHPAVRAKLRERVASDRGPYCLLAIPLLAETWPQYAWVDRVIVVDASDEVRRQRLMRRDDISAELAQKMMDAQATRERRRALADDVIDNDGAEEALDAQVRILHQRYLNLAERKRAGND
ncbi:dephospho-CoA kinase [Oleiagrimonas soli]|uniref:Dephospho-CoA kinase n=1 Tax=Oleiagrimonas soli TaxID=1543381 RepID=A0A099CU85_9GAMM|nr:dephospho-CoA kinase [Oleiagrimonas soli]KGI77256.1 dephospho-CoA kinase [Oleiagrimonas soli]MBB6185553.1 dephospho-CoA kinase [Oleiagrimonas soli]